MTSLSLVGGFNLAVNGLLPQGAADGAVFNMLFGQLGGGCGSFVNEVHSARTSTEKSALINAYAQGFAVRRLALNQVPTVAIKVLEDRDDAMSLMPWLLNEPHTGRDHARMIAIEIIRL